MARVLVVIGTVLLLALSGATANAAMGDPQIAALQVALAAQELYHGSIDGLTGPQTEAALLAFQGGAGLEQTGVADDATVQALGGPSRSLTHGHAVRLGDVGWEVAALQFRLAWHGFPSADVDGAFGPRLERSVTRFQRWAHLTADGIVGPSTLAALERGLPRARLAISAPVAAPFGDLFGPRGSRFHAGVDFPAERGTSVTAAAGGRVAYADLREGGHGNLVVVRHRRGVRTFYAHLSRIDVVVGQRVSRGEQLGLVGSTGRSTGPHLHFETRLRGALVDPLRSLGAG